MSAAVNYKTIHVDQIRTALMKKLEEVQELFAMDSDDLMIIIRHYRWNEDKMQQEWFNQQEKLKLELGLEFNKKLNQSPEISSS